MLDFLTFKIVITPSIVIVVYLFGVLLIPLAVYLLFKKINYKLSNMQSTMVQIVSVLFLELLWRMMNEFVIVYFKIYQALS